ncbi:MAG TPA: metalloregulator ArsR/SmtB family transcription factor [Longimicrobiales bacterium]|nr:metalloregulator ArsR/SmtB family transcription factor [Longimicrobiales bacterium]
MQRFTRVFKAISDETRLRIMGLIFRHGEICVCEVEQILDVTQSKASRHLRYLRDAGLLVDRRDGVTVYYGVPERLNPELSAVLMLLRGLLAADPLPDAAPRLVQLRAARGNAETPKPAGEGLAGGPTN